jgi:LmbE family N-acetylglucosaminyl deacetylase
MIWGGYNDTLLTPHMNRMVHDIETVLKKIVPDFIFVHYEDDTHQDHRALAKATVSATRYIRNVIFYEGPTTQNFAPTLFVDIRETIDEKFAMLLAHRSQVRKTNIEGLSITDVVRSTAVFRGIQGRVPYAEAFVPLRLFINVM